MDTYSFPKCERHGTYCGRSCPRCEPKGATFIISDATGQLNYRERHATPFTDPAGATQYKLDNVFEALAYVTQQWGYHCPFYIIPLPVTEATEPA